MEMNCSGGRRLPIGFRFLPTTQELIVYYLSKKVFDGSIFPGLVNDYDVYSVEPWNLPGAGRLTVAGTKYEEVKKGNEALYFFVSLKRKSVNGQRPDRRAGDGFWKASSGDSYVKNHMGKIVGITKSLVYYQYSKNDNRCCKNALKTDWIMHEHSLPNRSGQFHQWVVCKITKTGKLPSNFQNPDSRRLKDIADQNCSSSYPCPPEADSIVSEIGNSKENHSCLSVGVPAASYIDNHIQETSYSTSQVRLPNSCCPATGYQFQESSIQNQRDPFVNSAINEVGSCGSSTPSAPRAVVAIQQTSHNTTMYAASWDSAKSTTFLSSGSNEACPTSEVPTTQDTTLPIQSEPTQVESSFVPSKDSMEMLQELEWINEFFEG